MASLVLQDLVKTFPHGVTAVDRVNLQVADEQLLVLVGPSGCGKTTTLRLIAGLETATSGTIRLGGRVVNDLPPRDRDMAMVFQSHALYPHMTVYQNMAFGLKLRKSPRAEIDQRVRTTADLLGIAGLLDRKPPSLSGGQQQRVALGRAVVRRPACFLLDEPLSNLDAGLRIDLRAEIKRIQQRLQTTTVYVTHDQQEAMTLGHRVAVMYRGAIEQCGPPLDVYRHPANRFVAGFVGLPPMNFLEGRMLADGHTWWFDEGTTRIRVPEASAARLASRGHAPTVLGVRPAAIEIRPAGPPAAADNVLLGRIESLEPVGEVLDVVFSTARHRGLVARVDAARRLHLGDQCHFTLDPGRLHFFAPGPTGVNLTNT